MKLIYKKSIFVILGLLLAVAAYFFFDWLIDDVYSGRGEERRKEKSKKAMAEKIRNEFVKIAAVNKVDFILKGFVTDKKGNSLDNVKIRAERILSTGFDKLSRTEELSFVNGEFSLKYNGCHYLELMIEKDGYYDSKLNIDPGDGKYSSNLKKGVLVLNDFKIVLEKIGKLADLIEYEASMKFMCNGEGRVCNFDKSQYEPDEDVKSLFDPKKMPYNCAYVIPELDSSGKIITELFNEDCYFPRKIKMIMSSPGSGIVMYQTKSTGNVYHEMKEAPEDGYVNEISFSRSDLADKNIYFFFKVNGKYGKGVIRHINYRAKDAGVFRDGNDNVEMRNDGVLIVHAIFRINRDGTRNLETRD